MRARRSSHRHRVVSLIRWADLSSEVEKIFSSMHEPDPRNHASDSRNHTRLTADWLVLRSKKMFCWDGGTLCLLDDGALPTGDCHPVSGAATGLWRRQ
jgi:hypothetical protein